MEGFHRAIHSHSRQASARWSNSGPHPNGKRWLAAVLLSALVLAPAFAQIKSAEGLRNDLIQYQIDNQRVFLKCQVEPAAECPRLKEQMTSRSSALQLRLNQLPAAERNRISTEASTEGSRQLQRLMPKWPEYQQYELATQRKNQALAAQYQRDQEFKGMVAAGAVGLALVALVAVGIWFFRWSKRRNVRRNEQARVPDYRAWDELGKSKDERAAAIDRMFDARTAIVGYGTLWTQKYKRKNHEEKIVGETRLSTFRIQRGLAAFETREREFLRAAYHLYNAGNIGEQDWRYYSFAFVNGNGKAQIVSYDMAFGVDQKDDPQAIIKEFMDSVDGSVDSAVNRLLAQIAGLDSSTPAVAKFRSQLQGDGGGLTPQAPLKAIRRGETIRAGLILGTDESDPDKLWCFDGEGSLITVAPPGSGKTQSHVFPTLLNWHGPAVILDVKGEIYAGTSKWRSENVGPVFKFSPLDPANSHCYNPLSMVRAESDYVWEDSRFLADMLLIPSGAADPFWESKARDVLTAAIAYVCYSQASDNRPIAKVLDIIHGGEPWDEMIVGLRMAVDVRSMVNQGTSLGSMNEKTRDSVLQTAQASMSAWSGERIGRATSKSDWSPLDLRSGKNPTIYICLKPNEVEGYISVLRVFIAQHIRVLTSELPPRDTHPILFLLDELPRLRQMPPVEEALEIGRQFGIRLWMFTQSLGQLSNAYPNAEGMVGSCAVRMFMNPSLHDETAQKLAEDIGYRDSIIDGSRSRVVEPAVLAGPQFKDFVIVMASGSKPARVRKNYAYLDPAVMSKMGCL